jgi:RNA polymerase sigma-70 factor (ECF subfamily)
LDFQVEIKKHHKQAYAWAMQCCGFERETALDVLQDSYLKVLESGVNYKSKSSFKTWLFAIIKNTSIDHHTSRQKTLKVIRNLKDNQENAGGPIQQSKAEKLKVLLNQLSPKQSKMITLVFYHDQTIEEAAEIMNISLGSARTHYERGKKALKKLMEKEKSN